MAEVLSLDNATAEPSRVELDTSSFGDKVRKRLLRDAVLMYEANLRQGTHSTKTRGEIVCSGRKPWRQKGTGRARAGSFGSPLWRGGGVVFGPRPRDYSYSIPKRAKLEALKSAILGKVNDGEVRLMNTFGGDRPSTKSGLAALEKLSALDENGKGSVAIVINSDDDILLKSFRNLPKVSLIPASELTAYDVLLHRVVVFVGDSLDRVKERIQK